MTEVIPLLADKTERWSMERLRVSPANSNKHSEVQIREIAESMKAFGWTVPPLIDETGEVIAGEGRYFAGKLLGLTETAVIVARGWSPAMIEAYREADNELAKHSKIDEALQGAALARLIEEGFNVGVIGLSDKDVKRLTGDDDSVTPMIVQEVETGPVKDEFWISVRGPLRHQAEALHRLQDTMAGLDGVSVELGTFVLK